MQCQNLKLLVLTLSSLLETGSVNVHWTIHNPRSLSAKDTFMDRLSDKQAQLIGTVDESQA